MITIGQHTPWGTCDACDEEAPGITFVTTTSHGGYFLDDDRQAKVRALFPALADEDGSWYEEDCMWAVVALVFHEIIKQEQMIAEAVETATGTFRMCVEGIERGDTNPPNYWRQTGARWRPVVEWLKDTPEGRTCLQRAETFKASKVRHWRRGGLSSPPNGSPPKSWSVNLSRGKGRMNLLFKAYPTKTYYTSDELLPLCVDPAAVGVTTAV